MGLKQILHSYTTQARTRWTNFRDAIVLEDIERSLDIIRKSPTNGSYIPADFMFIQASYAFARGETEKGRDICMNMQRSHPGYDPSLRFYLEIPTEVKDMGDLVGLSEEMIQLRNGENFLSRFLTSYPNYTFQDFSNYFSLQRTIDRESLRERLGREKEDLRMKG